MSFPLFGGPNAWLFLLCGLLVAASPAQADTDTMPETGGDPRCDVGAYPDVGSQTPIALLQCRGSAFLKQHLNDQALQAFDRAHALAMDRKDTLAAVQSALQIARINQLRNQSDRSFAILTDTYEFVRKQGHEKDAQDLLDALAAAYYNSGRLDLAETYYLELLDRDQVSGDANAQAVTRFNLAHVYASQGRFDAADAEFRQSFELGQQLGDSAGVAVTLKAWGENAHAQGDLALARSRFEQALRAFVANNDQAQQGAVLRHLGDIAVKQAEAGRAIDLYLAAIRILEPLEFELPLLRSYRGLAQAYALESQYEKAYIAHQIHVEKLTRKVRRESGETVQRLQSEFEARFKTQELSERNKQLRLENARQQQQLAYDRLWRNGLILIALLAVFASGLLWLLWRNGRRFGVAMTKLATTDGLTGLLNRRSILEFGHAEWARAQLGAAFCVLLLDIDHFKSINDNHGHAAGDQVLKGVASTVLGAMRTTDRLGRYGGEEFLIITPDADIKQALGVAERVRRAIEAAQFEVLGEARVTVSIGVAINSDGDNLEALIQAADEALYTAKEQGRNRVCRSTRSTSIATQAQPLLTSS